MCRKQDQGIEKTTRNNNNLSAGRALGDQPPQVRVHERRAGPLLRAVAALLRADPRRDRPERHARFCAVLFAAPILVDLCRSSIALMMSQKSVFALQRHTLTWAVCVINSLSHSIEKKNAKKLNTKRK